MSSLRAPLPGAGAGAGRPRLAASPGGHGPFPSRCVPSPPPPRLRAAAPRPRAAPRSPCAPPPAARQPASPGARARAAAGMEGCGGRTRAPGPACARARGQARVRAWLSPFRLPPLRDTPPSPALPLPPFAFARPAAARACEKRPRACLCPGPAARQHWLRGAGTGGGRGATPPSKVPARKIVISIQKLKERQNLLKSLERDIIEGGSLRTPLQELHQMILTPIKAYSPPSATPEARHREPSMLGPESPSPDGKDTAATVVTSTSASTTAGASGGLQPHQLSSCDGELAVAPLPEGDLPGQFTRVMGKVCTQLLVSRPDEENISSYLQLIDKCLLHEAFTETQKKRLLSWKQQVQKLFRSFPRKTLLDISGYRQQRNRGFSQSNSLPTAGSVGGGMGRRNPRQYQIPSRNVPSARLGLLGTSGFVSSNPRHTATNPTIMKQGRQNLWFANPGGSNSMPSRTHSSVQRTRSLPVHTSPQNILMFQQPEFQLPVTEPDINNRLESLCLSMTEHALGDGVDRTSTI